MWMPNVKLESNLSLEYFWNSTRKKGTLLKTILGWLTLVVFLLKITSCTCFEVSELKLIFHRKAHLLISFKWLLRLLAVVSDFQRQEKGKSYRIDE